MPNDDDYDPTPIRFEGTRGDLSHHHAPSEPKPPSIIGTPEGAAAFYASIGPWWTPEAAAAYCGISDQELRQWTRTRKALGVEFADGKYYYPEQQFKDGHVVDGLDRILTALAPAYVAPESQVAWLADEAYENGEITRWDLLRRDDLALVLSWAKADTERVLRQ